MDYKLKPDLAGRKVQCQICSLKFRVPEMAHPKIKAEKPSASKIQIRCPRCLADYRLGEKYLGKWVRCKDCREQFQVSLPNHNSHLENLPESELLTDVVFDPLPPKTATPSPHGIASPKTQRNPPPTPSNLGKQKYNHDSDDDQTDQDDSQYQLFQDAYGNSEIIIEKRNTLEPIVLGTPGLPMNSPDVAHERLPPRAPIGRSRRMSTPKQMGYVASFLIAFFSLFLQKLKIGGVRAAFRYSTKSNGQDRTSESKPLSQDQPPPFLSSLPTQGSPAPAIAFSIQGQPIGNLLPYRTFYLTQIENLHKIADELTSFVDRTGSDERLRRIFHLRDLILGFLNKRPPGSRPPNPAEHQKLAKELGAQVHKAMDLIFLQLERLQKSKMMEPGLAWDLKRIEEDTLKFETTLTDYGDLTNPQEFLDVMVKNLKTNDDFEFLKAKLMEVTKAKSIKAASNASGEARISLWPLNNSRLSARSFRHGSVLKLEGKQIWLDASSIDESAVANWKQADALSFRTNLDSINGVKNRTPVFTVPQQIHIK